MPSGGSLILVRRSQFVYSGGLSRDSICVFVYVWEVFDCQTGGSNVNTELVNILLQSIQQLLTFKRLLV